MKQIKQPQISIVMPVYNAGDFLDTAIASIRRQTHKNWELIAVDDHSTDNSPTILNKYKKLDKRIRVYKNPKNLGVSATANIAISHAKSKWIARMDADDIMHPKRLETQLKTLIAHPSVVILGSQCNLIDKAGQVIGKKLFPTCPKAIFDMLFWACPVQQPSIMVNTNLLPKNFIWYNQNKHTGEEINFLIRVSKYGSIVNSKSTLLNYRIHSHNLSLNQNQKRVFFSLFKTRINAVISRKYTPGLSSIFTGLLELIIVTILPQKAILPLFQLVRGMKAISLKLNFPGVFPHFRYIHIEA